MAYTTACTTVQAVNNPEKALTYQELRLMAYFA